MIDGKAIEAVLAIFLPLILSHRQKSRQPFVLGLSGLQGSGKSTWAQALSKALTLQHGVKSRILSLDDLYKQHSELVTIRDANADNKLLRTRGQPGTHDEALAQQFFNEIKQINEQESQQDFVQWPAYDKSLHAGQGDRVPRDQWEKVPTNEGLDVLIFEGWCLGFQPLTETQVAQKWKHDQAATASSDPVSEETSLVQTLANHDLEHLLLLNDNLRRYCSSFMGPRSFDGFLHLSTDKLLHVYEWRLDQERALRKHKPGMADEQVVQFVRGYMPAYELYLDDLQQNSFFARDEQKISYKKHVQIVLNRGREVVQIKEME